MARDGGRELPGEALWQEGLAPHPAPGCQGCVGAGAEAAGAGLPGPFVLHLLPIRCV